MFLLPLESVRPVRNGTTFYLSLQHSLFLSQLPVRSLRKMPVLGTRSQCSLFWKAPTVSHLCEQDAASSQIFPPHFFFLFSLLSFLRSHVMNRVDNRERPSLTWNIVSYSTFFTPFSSSLLPALRCKVDFTELSICCGHKPAYFRSGLILTIC